MTDSWDSPQDKTPDDKSPTLSRAGLNRVAIKKMIEAVAQSGEKPVTVPPEATVPHDNTPWILQQFFNGEVDLDAELTQRFMHMPVMASVSFRSMGTKSQRGVATLSAQDGSAQVIIDVDSTTHVTQMSYTFGSMLSLRFQLRELSDADRARWVDLMRRPEGGLAFLWGPSRWEHDYLICIVRKYFTNLFAFSPHNFEAGIRMTPSVTRELLDWLEKFWKAAEKPKEEPPTLLTW